MAVLTETDFRPLLNLATIFQFEQRQRIREKLVEALAILCKYDAKVVQVLLPTVLPLDLIKAVIQLDFAECQMVKNSLSCLASLFATGEGLPYGHFGEFFLLFFIFRAISYFFNYYINPHCSSL